MTTPIGGTGHLRFPADQTQKKLAANNLKLLLELKNRNQRLRMGALQRLAAAAGEGNLFLENANLSEARRTLAGLCFESDREMRNIAANLLFEILENDLLQGLLRGNGLETLVGQTFSGEHKEEVRDLLEVLVKKSNSPDQSVQVAKRVLESLNGPRSTPPPPQPREAVLPEEVKNPLVEINDHLTGIQENVKKLLGQWNNELSTNIVLEHERRAAGKEIIDEMDLLTEVETGNDVNTLEASLQEAASLAERIVTWLEVINEIVSREINMEAPQPDIKQAPLCGFDELDTFALGLRDMLKSDSFERVRVALTQSVPVEVLPVLAQYEKRAEALGKLGFVPQQSEIQGRIEEIEVLRRTGTDIISASARLARDFSDNIDETLVGIFTPKPQPAPAEPAAEPAPQPPAQHAERKPQTSTPPPLPRKRSSGNRTQVLGSGSAWGKSGSREADKTEETPMPDIKAEDTTDEVDLARDFISETPITAPFAPKARVLADLLEDCSEKFEIERALADRDVDRLTRVLNDSEGWTALNRNNAISNAYVDAISELVNIS